MKQFERESLRELKIFYLTEAENRFVFLKLQFILLHEQSLNFFDRFLTSFGMTVYGELFGAREARPYSLKNVSFRYRVLAGEESVCKLPRKLTNISMCLWAAVLVSNLEFQNLIALQNLLRLSSPA